MLAGECTEFGQIDQFEHRIGRGLGPDHLGVRLQRSIQRGLVVEIDEAEIEPRAALAHTVEQAIRSAVQIIHRDYVAAAVDKFEDGARRCQARREGIALGAALKIGNATLVGHPGRVLRTRVFVALVLARALLHVSGCRVDRRHDRAGRWIGRLSGVDGARTDAERRCGFLGHDGLVDKVTGCVDAGN